MPRFDGCPDRMDCVDGCPGPGVVTLHAGDTVVTKEPFCTQTRPDHPARQRLLCAIARRGICGEAVYYTAKHNMGRVVLVAQPANLDADPTTHLMYDPPAPGVQPAA
jgi:hypothetical protein